MDHRIVYIGNQRCALYSGANRCALPIYSSRVEYLESTGTQYINTNLLPSVNYHYHIIYKIVTLGNNVLFGERGSGTYDTSLNQIYFSSLYTNQNQKTFLRNLYNVNDLDLNITPNVDILVNTPLMQCNNTSFSGSIKPIYLLCINDKGTPTAFSKCKIFNFSIIDNNSTILDFIPVRKGTTGYLYDRVSKQLFANAGTGNFILGPDITD